MKVNYKKTVVSFFAALAILLTSSIALFGGLHTAAAGSPYTMITAFAGADETQMNFNWYSYKRETEQTQTLQIGEMAEDDVDFPYDYEEIFVTGTASQKVNYYVFKATVTGLKPNTEYFYRVGEEGNWSEVCSFTTLTNGNEFSFMALGDAQLGTNGDNAEDGALWSNTLNTVMQQYSPAFLLHMGDEVESFESSAASLSISEEQYEYFFGADVLRTVPYVGVIGNHEFSKNNWSEHHNAPNLSSIAVSDTAGEQSADYWLVVGNMLLCVLNSNVRDSSQHEKFLEQAIAAADSAYGDRIQWRVVAMHHSIYGVSELYDDEDVVIRRPELSEIFKNCSIDMVLMAHEHVYARSYMMNGTQPIVPEEGSEHFSIMPDGEILYVTLSSSTGNKCWDIVAGDEEYVAAGIQTYAAQVSEVTVRENMLKIATYDLEGNLLDDFTIYKEDPEQVVPTITCTAPNEITAGDSFSVMEGIKATDAIEGDLTASVAVTGTVDAQTAGRYELVYTVRNTYGKTGTFTRVVTVKESKGSGCSSRLTAKTLLWALPVIAAAVALAARKKSGFKSVK